MFGIGVDADQGYLGTARPDERHEEGRRGRVQDDRGRSEGRAKFKTNFNAIFTVKTNGVGYGKISSRTQPDVEEDFANIRKQIASGKIKVTAQSPPPATG